MDSAWLHNRILEVLRRGYLMSLGTRDDSGVWVSDVIFIHDEALRIAWMSDPDARHSRAILVHTQVAASITVSAAHTPNLGLQIAGRAERIEGPRHDLAVLHYTKRGHPPPNVSEDVLQGDSWYLLHPERFELIDEEHFGFTKQRHDLES